MMSKEQAFMKRIRQIHFVGIGGAGMGGIAEVLINLKYKVSGSDLNENSMVRHLRAQGAVIHIGHARQHVTGAQVVVVSSAIDERNPEIIAAREQRIPIVARAEMLAELMRFREGIAVAGTHGKTTTTSLVASLLAEGGLDPTYVIGGRLNSSASHARLGESHYLVAEADESDASFLHLTPVIAIVTNIDEDHLGTYDGDFGKLKQTFIDFIHHLPFYGLAVLCIDDPVIREILPQLARPWRSYGESEDADMRVSDIVQNGARTAFSLRIKDQDHALQVNLPGRHNVLNAAAAITVALELGVSLDAISRALEGFQGIGRRFGMRECVHQGKQFLHIDDYGHHPTELQATLQAIRAGWSERRLVMVFQPHRYSRTRDLFEDFAAVLSEPDLLLLMAVYSAGEEPMPGADSRSLARAIRARGQVEPIYVQDGDEVLEVLAAQLQDGDIVLTQGAGSIGLLSQQLAEGLCGGGE